jgi:hypothetical protein
MKQKNFYYHSLHLGRMTEQGIQVVLNGIIVATSHRKNTFHEDCVILYMLNGCCYWCACCTYNLKTLGGRKNEEQGLDQTKVGGVV